jgi:hypothetical protein
MVSAFWAISGVFACTIPNPRFRPGAPGADAAEVAPFDTAAETTPVDSAAPDFTVDGDEVGAETADTVVLDSQPDAVAVDTVPLDVRDAGDGQASDLLDAADAVVVLPAPFAYWRLDEAVDSPTAADSAGSNAGMLSSNADFIAPGFPQAGFPNPGALALDGNSHVVLGATGFSRLDQPTTISLWFFIPAATLPLVNRKNVLVLRNAVSGQALQIGIQNGYATVWRSASGPIFVYTPTLIAGWHHLAYSCDGTGQSLYLNGAPHQTVAIPPPALAVTVAYLGTYDPAEGSERFTGQIDDVRIYKRVLDVAQISALASGQQ